MCPRPDHVGRVQRPQGAKGGSVLRFEHVIFNLQDLSAPTSASRGCLSDGQGSQHNAGLLEQEDILLIAR